eukprot:scaffold20628_cov31-Tisochrysis_lutea.AAC.4
MGRGSTAHDLRELRGQRSSCKGERCIARAKGRAKAQFHIASVDTNTESHAAASMHAQADRPVRRTQFISWPMKRSQPSSHRKMYCGGCNTGHGANGYTEPSSDFVRCGRAVKAKKK